MASASGRAGRGRAVDASRRGPDEHDEHDSDVDTASPNGHSSRARAAVSPMTVMRQAMQQIAELTGRAPDTVSAIEATEEGWSVDVELVELERVPSTTNILATYEVRLDDEGNVLGFRRLRRYFRNAAEEG